MTTRIYYRRSVNGVVVEEYGSRWAAAGLAVLVGLVTFVPWFVGVMWIVLTITGSM